MIKTKRVYDRPSRQDGLRVLVDRLWPRGMKKEDAKVDLWLKEVAPSDGLRKWYGHDPEKWPEFRRRYFRELDRKEEEVSRLREGRHGRNVTLLYSAREERYNNAAALKEYLEGS